MVGAPGGGLPWRSYSVVIPTKDRAPRAAAAVTALLAQTRRPERIVVVDAGTPALDIPAAVRELAEGAGVELVVVHTEPSTSAQRNRGVDRVATPLVLLLDDDVSLEPAYAERLLARWGHDGLEAFGAMIGVPEVVPDHGRAGRALRRALMLHVFERRGRATTLRRSGKVRYVPNPASEVTVPVVGAGATLMRTDLLRRHRFDERFPGYAPGEDLELSLRLAADAPILQTPAVRYRHHWDPRERTSATRWALRGRRETYFRLRHLGRSPLDLAAFALSLVAETVAAAADSARERDPRHVRGFVAGVVEALREWRAGRRAYPRPSRSAIP
jgi:GT2 family glycosyltransferase